MGVRYYSPTTGSFSSTDPVPDANATAFSYPADPVNSFDINGKNPFGSCFGRSQYRVLEKYWSKYTGVIKMQCGVHKGKTGFGLRHLTVKHKQDWLNKMAGWGSWKDFVHWAIKETLRVPSSWHTQNGQKMCYSTPLRTYRMVNGKPRLWEKFYSNVIVSKNNHTIITAFPSGKAHC